ncbi:hypothetical protein GQ44DRAFT_652378 [Phaeosphaeriaceae sp. PMI808]|nr:hypothetical protein GQ44DRAFT_652378 [Phaeosphaeriaceae sp. PMI808]
MCTKLVDGLQKFAPLDPSIQDLIDAAKDVKILPSAKPLRLGVPGGQGIGKSTLINALLGRFILSTSGGGRACTAFVTYITYKEGADDHTKQSDVTILFHNEAEMRVFIKEQITNWCEGRPDLDPTQANGEHEYVKIEDYEEEEITSPDSPKDSSAKRLAAETAKDFFEVIFNTCNRAELKEWLHLQLYEPSFREEEFLSACCQMAKDQLTHLDSELTIRDGASLHKNIPDTQLRKIRNTILRLWPFVKSMKISTGHMLLRYGMVIYDMPGYGDISQLRKAIINQYRKETDFEMVVAPLSRSRTSSTQDRYLNKSIRQKGADHTIVVHTRSDELLNPRDFDEEICQVQEEPFLSLWSRIKELDNCDTNIDTTQDPRYLIYCEALAAFIQRESAHAQEILQARNIRSFSVSAGTYLDWKAKYKFKSRPSPPLSKDGCGIAELRKFLYQLPADNNHQIYFDHVYKRLPRLIVLAQLVFSAYVEDDVYAEMRQGLGLQIRLLNKNLKDDIEKKLEVIICRPCSAHDERDVHNKMKKFMHNQWDQPNIYWNGFESMLKVQGIPMRGRYHGCNLNDDILKQFEEHVTRWYNKLRSMIEELVQCLGGPVFDLLKAIDSSITQSTADGDLRRDADKSLEYAIKQTQKALNTLSKELGNALHENQLYFTTEDDIYCPVAKEMIPVYDRALTAEKGRGVYHRTREEIIRSIMPDETTPHQNPMFPILERIEAQMMTRQRAIWKKQCENFVEAACGNLWQFARASDNLLLHAAHATEQHQKARDELRVRLEEFKLNLADLQSNFPRGNGTHQQ